MQSGQQQILPSDSDNTGLPPVDFVYSGDTEYYTKEQGVHRGLRASHVSFDLGHRTQAYVQIIFGKPFIVLIMLMHDHSYYGPLPAYISKSAVHRIHVRRINYLLKLASKEPENACSTLLEDCCSSWVVAQYCLHGNQDVTVHVSECKLFVGIWKFDSDGMPIEGPNDQFGKDIYGLDLYAETRLPSDTLLEGWWALADCIPASKGNTKWKHV